MSGTSETTFAPNNAITREQMAAILMRFCENIAK
ncbi:MAG TPA: S-layer homology domain-containing protein [Butyricicoccus pullicaecorum]|nr:S-layer homology domain-containing protein [Butyricicoccus pullicaecorum]